MSDSEGRAPAGWYSDPELIGTQRYWDGSAWTEHRSPIAEASAGAVVPPVPGHQPMGGTPTSGSIKPLIWILVVVMLAGGGWFAYDQLKSKPYSIRESAVEECKEYVRSDLKSPSSATFDPEPVAVNPDHDDVWEVIGSVDADNAFGTSIRNRFDCKLEVVSKGKWRLVDFSMG